MPEVTIKYKKPETLKILKGLAKYFDFTVSTDKDTKKARLEDVIIRGDNFKDVLKSEKEKKPRVLNGVTILPADKNIDTSALTKLFSEKSIDADRLRKDAWQRKI